MKIVVDKENLRLTEKDFTAAEDDELIVTISNDLAANEIVMSFFNIQQIEEKIEKDIQIDLKTDSTEKLVQVFKEIMKLDYVQHLTNKSIMLNIIAMLKTYNSFSDEYFNDQRIFFSSIEQFLDVKIELQEEIKAIDAEIATYFFSILRSISKTEYTILDSYVDIPKFYKAFFLTTNLVTVSGLLAQMPNDYQYNLKYVKGAHLYLSNLIQTYGLAANIMNTFFEEFNRK